MFLEGFPGPPPCPPCPPHAPQSGSRSPPDPHAHDTRPPAARDLRLQQGLHPKAGAPPWLLPGVPGPSQDLSARRPPRSSSRRPPGFCLSRPSRALPVSILRPFLLPFPHPPKNDPAPPRTGVGGRRDPAVSGRGRLAPAGSALGPALHALYLRRARLPPQRRLRSASVPRASSPRAHASLARPFLSKALQAVRAQLRTERRVLPPVCLTGRRGEASSWPLRAAQAHAHAAPSCRPERPVS